MCDQKVHIIYKSLLVTKLLKTDISHKYWVIPQLRLVLYYICYSGVMREDGRLAMGG